MTREEIFDVLRSSILTVIPEVEASRITRDESLRELGANSVDRADILTETLGILRIRVRLTEFAGLRNIGDLVDLLHERSS